MDDLKFKEAQDIKREMGNLEGRVSDMTSILDNTSERSHIRAQILSVMDNENISFSISRERFNTLVEEYREDALKRLDELDREFKEL